MERRTWIATGVASCGLLGAAWWFLGVSAAATVDPRQSACPPDSPIQLTIHNRTFHRPDMFTVELDARRDHQGDNLLKQPDQMVWLSIAPFHTGVACLADPSVSVPKPVPTVAPTPEQIKAALVGPRETYIAAMAAANSKANAATTIITSSASEAAKVRAGLDLQDAMDEQHKVEAAYQAALTQAKTTPPQRFDSADVWDRANARIALARDITVRVVSIAPSN